MMIHKMMGEMQELRKERGEESKKKWERIKEEIMKMRLEVEDRE